MDSNKLLHTSPEIAKNPRSSYHSYLGPCRRVWRQMCNQRATCKRRTVNIYA